MFSAAALASQRDILANAMSLLGQGSHPSAHCLSSGWVSSGRRAPARDSREGWAPLRGPSRGPQLLGCVDLGP